MKFKTWFPIFVGLVAVFLGWYFWYNSTHEVLTPIFNPEPPPVHTAKPVTPASAPSADSSAAYPTYQNDEFGFKFTLGNDWKGYRADRAGTDNAGGPVLFYFELPADQNFGNHSGWAYLFYLSVYKKSNYYKISKELREQGWLDEAPGSYITESKDYVFTWKGAQALPDNSTFNKAAGEIRDMIKTFKLTK